MKIEFIKRGAETRLILIFAGWSTDARFYSNCIVDGWDTAVVYDYRDLSVPEIPRQYSTVYVFAYSLGVWAAARSQIRAAVSVAVCGTSVPVSDYLGIPENVFIATAKGLSAGSLLKFHRRMAGDRLSFEKMRQLLPQDPDIESLRDELMMIAGNVAADEHPEYSWNRVYVAMADNIFPAVNQLRFWTEFGNPQIVRMECSHFADMAAIVRQCIPDVPSIGRGFSKAWSSYRNNAVVQSEVCRLIADKLNIIFGFGNDRVASLLEIGAGCGMLTEMWGNLLNVESATYVDICHMPRFGRAAREEYILADAETWLEDCDSRFDLILSASTIQWFVDPVGYLGTIKSHLNPGGYAVVSTFTAGNLSELDDFRVSPIIYRSPSDYRIDSDILTMEWKRTLSFRSSRELLMHLRLTGVTPPSVSEGNKNGAGLFSRPLRLSELPRQLTYTPMVLVIKAD